MSMDAIINLEEALGRKFTEQESARLREIGRQLHLRDDDALWSLLAALEYQRIFYEALPDRIADASPDRKRRGTGRTVIRQDSLCNPCAFGHCGPDMPSCLWQSDALGWLLHRLRPFSPACCSFEYAVRHPERRLELRCWYLSFCNYRTALY